MFPFLKYNATRINMDRTIVTLLRITTTQTLQTTLFNNKAFWYSIQINVLHEIYGYLISPTLFINYCCIWVLRRLLTSQVISVAFYIEREKSDKFCSGTLISA